MKILKIVTLVLCTSLFYATSICAQDAAGDAGAAAIDIDRCTKYVETIENIIAHREGLKKRCADLEGRDLSLQESLRSAWFSAVSKTNVLNNTPQLSVAPYLSNVIRSQRLSNSDLQSQFSNNGYLWYALQDNTFYRNQLMLSIWADQIQAESQYANLYQNRVALRDIADSADRNFEDFRKKADWLGRRSRMEHDAVLKLVREARIDDERNAGLFLIEASSLRTTGQFGECLDRMDYIDDYFLPLQIIHVMAQAQIEFLNDNNEKADKMINEAGGFALENKISEPILVRGWLALANGNEDAAKNFANSIRNFEPNNVEAAVLGAWANLQLSSKRGRDAVTLLRSVSVHVNEEDWYFHEALANAHSAAGDKKSAIKHIDIALDHAPSHVRAELLRQKADMEKNKVPVVAWKDRLKASWKLDPK